MEEKIQLAIDILKENGLVEELEPDELIQISNELNVDATKYSLVAKIITYIRKRTLEKLSQTESFKQSFPERCVGSKNSNRGNFIPEHREPIKEGEPLPDRTILLKAQRLENRQLYKAIMSILNTSLYTMFAIERIKVLHQALDKIEDESVNDRNKAEYMKLFLAETRKPDNAKGLELNVNLQQNNIDIEQVNANLSLIANKLENRGAGSIIDMLEKKE